jgi:hypothetical protein
VLLARCERWVHVWKQGSTWKNKARAACAPDQQGKWISRGTCRHTCLSAKRCRWPEKGDRHVEPGERPGTKNSAAVTPRWPEGAKSGCMCGHIESSAGKCQWAGTGGGECTWKRGSTCERKLKQQAHQNSQRAETPGGHADILVHMQGSANGRIQGVGASLEAGEC